MERSKLEEKETELEHWKSRCDTALAEVEKLKEVCTIIEVNMLSLLTAIRWFDSSTSISIYTYLSIQVVEICVLWVPVVFRLMVDLWTEKITYYRIILYDVTIQNC